MKNSAKGIVYVVLYVFNNLLVVKPKTIDEAVEQLKKNELVLKVTESLQAYPVLK